MKALQSLKDLGYLYKEQESHTTSLNEANNHNLDQNHDLAWKRAMEQAEKFDLTSWFKAQPHVLQSPSGSSQGAPKDKFSNPSIRSSLFLGNNPPSFSSTILYPITIDNNSARCCPDPMGSNHPGQGNVVQSNTSVSSRPFLIHPQGSQDFGQQPPNDSSASEVSQASKDRTSPGPQMTEGANGSAAPLAVGLAQTISNGLQVPVSLITSSGAGAPEGPQPADLSNVPDGTEGDVGAKSKLTSLLENDSAHTASFDVGSESPPCSRSNNELFMSSTGLGSSLKLSPASAIETSADEPPSIIPDLPAQTAQALPLPSGYVGSQSLVFVKGSEGPSEAISPENQFKPPTQAAPVMKSLLSNGSISSPEEPLRLYAEWSDQGVRLWLGANANYSLPLDQLAQQVQQWLANHGERLLSLVCNGRAYWQDPIEEEASREITASTTPFQYSARSSLSYLILSRSQQNTQEALWSPH